VGRVQNQDACEGDKPIDRASAYLMFFSFIGGSILFFVTGLVTFVVTEGNLATSSIAAVGSVIASIAVGAVSRAVAKNFCDRNNNRPFQYYSSYQQISTAPNLSKKLEQGLSDSYINK
jgi:hypothetical protein